MTQTQNPFVVGAEVVKVNTHWGRRLGKHYKIAKVYKNGNFILEGDLGKAQYKPGGGWNGHWYARQVSKGYFRSEHLELWDAERHGAELTRKAREHDEELTKDAFKAWLDKRSLSDDELQALKNMMQQKAETPQ